MNIKKYIDKYRNQLLHTEDGRDKIVLLAVIKDLEILDQELKQLEQDYNMAILHGAN